MKKIIYSFLLITAVLLQGCTEIDLEVINDQDPNSSQLGSESTAENIYKNWLLVVNEFNSPALALATMADATSCSWGNAGMRDMSSEPRIAFDNRPTYGNAQISEDYFNGLYAILSDANSIAGNIVNGTGTFSNDDKIESIARLAQALSIGYLALIYDKVSVSDETGLINEGEPMSYSDAMNIAIEKIDLAIKAAERGTFSIREVNGLVLDQSTWAQYLNSIAARLIVNNARNKQQRDNINWTKVLAYANKGLSYDFSILGTGNGDSDWYLEWMDYSTYGGWGRVDMRLINLMDPNTTSYWPADQVTLPESTSDDKRLVSDFEYLDSQSFRSNRGTYHFSSYRHSRYDDRLANSYKTKFNEFLKTENDMYIAEAQLRTGDLAGAAATINAGTRKTRGELADVGVTDSEVSDAIHYERMIELNNTSIGLCFFEMRGKDLLQKNTPLHFPIPGGQSKTFNLPYYTFGGDQGVSGQDYSNGGWR